MEIRILQEQEIPLAADLAASVYEKCIAPYGISQEMVQAFYEYNTPGMLVNRARVGQLVVWGAFQGNQLVGTSALQPEGHISMLYVLPQFTHQGIGKLLIREMEGYAKSNLGISVLTVNVMPAWSESFFQKCGFQADQGVEPGLAFVPMHCQLRREVTYEKRSFPQKAAIVLGSLLIVASMILAFGYMMVRWT